jgi:DNA-binding CsgD family transcriptional regulator
LGGTGFVQVRRNCFTHKEHDILSLLASGLRNDQIAHKMNIAEVTVRKHLLSVRKKLGAKTREEAVAIALRDEWLGL